MRLLLDEFVPARLWRSLPSHSVKTVVEMGREGVKNGALLALAAKEFDAFLTVDKNIPYQQNVANLPVAVIVLEAYSNALGALLPLVHILEQVLGSMQPGTFIRVRT